MSLSILPNEILLLIISHLETWGPVNALTQCNRKLHSQLLDTLYLHNIQHEQCSALRWAAKHGSLTVARRMLDLGANVNLESPLQLQTPLHLAAEGDHLPLVKYLLENGADPRARNSRDCTPLAVAAGSGAESVVRYLFERGDSDPGPCGPERARRSLLYFPCKNGHISVVRLLLAQKDVDVSAGQESLHPLMVAVSEQNEEIVRLLLDDGRFDPDYAYNKATSQTVLMWAAGRGAAGVVKALLEKGADPNLRNSFSSQSGQTALFVAITNDRDEVVRILLEREDVDRNLRDGRGRTPLGWAAWCGSMTVLRRLLDTPSVDPLEGSKSGDTALEIAIERGQIDVLRVLIADGRIPLDNPTGSGRRPLSVLASLDTADVIDLLVNAGAVIESKDNAGRTPLSWAASGGNEAVIDRLVKNGGAVDSRDRDGRTPLSWAATGKRADVIDQLVKAGAAVESRDHEGRTPLSWAAGSGTAQIARRLLDHGAKIDSKDGREWTPPFWAAYRWHGTALGLFLAEGANPHDEDPEGFTMLQVALRNGPNWSRTGPIEVTKSLLAAGVDPNLRDKDGRTPLSWAAGCLFVGTVDLLMKNETTDRNVVDNEGRTAKWWATSSHDQERREKREDEIDQIVRLLEPERADEDEEDDDDLDS